MNTLSKQNWATLAVLLVAGMLLGCGKTQITSIEFSPDNKQDSNDVAPPESEMISVALEIKFNGRAEDVEFSMECQSGSSVFDATLQACESNQFQLDYSGKEPQYMFVKALGGIVNEKSAGDNWTYRVNGELGKFGCGIAEVENGDRITWSFGKYDPEK